MRALAAMTFFGCCSYAMLLPVAPLWAVHGGASEAGAGLVNGVLLLFTVITQLMVPSALQRFGWRPVLTVGMLLLGLPSLAYLLNDALGPVLVVSALRGVGFGIVTVTGSAAVAQIVPEERRGEGIGAYGLAIALPGIVLLPLGPWIAERSGFWVAFLISALPVLGVPPALRLARVIHGKAADALHQMNEGLGAEVLEATGTAYVRLARPMVLLLAVTLCGGAVNTFTPQMVTGAVLTTFGLFVMGVVTAVTRWRVGAIADRYGVEPFLWPLVVLTGLGMTLAAWAVHGSHTVAWEFLLAMVVVGLGYGTLQNLTLVMAFKVVSSGRRNLASALWNVGFDAGTGFGSVIVGAVAGRWSFAIALCVAAVLSVATVPVALAGGRGNARSGGRGNARSTVGQAEHDTSMKRRWR